MTDTGPRGICPLCHHSIALGPRGVLARHYIAPQRFGIGPRSTIIDGLTVCAGTGRQPDRTP
jgi:hypothetical protein